MIAVFIGLLFICVRIEASMVTSEDDGPTWTLLSSDGVDLCTETECTASYWKGVIFQALWSFEGDAPSPFFTFSDEKDLLFFENKKYYLYETDEDEKVWPGEYKFGSHPCNCTFLGGTFNLTTPLLAFHQRSAEEFLDGKYIGDLSFTFPYREDIIFNRTLDFPTKTVIVERLYEEGINDSNSG